MPIIVNLDVMMAKRKISLGDLAEKIDLTPANLSILKTGKLSDREGKSHPLLNLRGYLQGTRLSTWRYSRI